MSVKTVEINSNEDNNHTNPKKGFNLRRKHILIGLIVLILVFDLVVSMLVVQSFVGGKADPSSDPIELIRSQLINNRNSAIGNVGYDSALTFATYEPYITLVDASKLKPLTNNYLTSVGSGSSKEIKLIDQTAVARVLSAYSEWAAYLNQNKTDGVSNNTLSNSKAEQFFTSYQGYQIAISRLAIGELRHSGKDCYMLVNPEYTLLKDGSSTLVNNIFLIKLVPSGNTLAISNIEQLALPTSE
jgi:hypothetical protein